MISHVGVVVIADGLSLSTAGRTEFWPVAS